MATLIRYKGFAINVLAIDFHYNTIMFLMRVQEVPLLEVASAAGFFATLSATVAATIDG